MEHQMDSNHLANTLNHESIEKKSKKKKNLQTQRSQVNKKLANSMKKYKPSKVKNCLKVDPNIFSGENNEVLSRSNRTPTLYTDNMFQKIKISTKYSSSVVNDSTPNLLLNYSNSSPSKSLKENSSSETKTVKFNINMDSNVNFNKKETARTGLKNNNQGNILLHKHLNQFEKCENSIKVRCNFCHCFIRCDESLLTEHTTKCKKPIKSQLVYINEYNCLICTEKFKTLKEWRLHAISNSHLSKCIRKNDFVSYNCGGCKTIFYGRKAQILNHCKTIHKDGSKLPCIFKCMKEIFDQFVSTDSGSRESCKFCGPCKNYSYEGFYCDSYNHVNKKTNNFTCNSCLIEFICNKDVYNNHLLSCEHIMLEHLKASANENTLSVKKLKLPLIFFSRFTIDCEKATCNNCNFQMIASEKTIILHLTAECVYKPNFDGKNTTNVKKYYCAVCNKTTSDFCQWKYHLLTPAHLIKCHNCNDLVSYTCELCELHCYGNAHYVSEHQDIHPNISEKKLSEYTAYNFQCINRDLTSKHFYYCEDCEIYGEVNSSSDHWNKSHKTKLKHVTCQPCRTEFFCIEGKELFSKHILSSEHIILKYFANKNSLQEQVSSPFVKSEELNLQNINDQKSISSKSSLEMLKNNVLFILKPYLNWFKSVEDQNKATCLSCDDLIELNENSLLGHLLTCHQNLTQNKHEHDINYFKCIECDFSSNIYDVWEIHAISHTKFNTDGLYSYVCTSCCSLLYGKIKDIILHSYNDHRTVLSSLPIETVLLKEQLTKKMNDSSKALDIMYYCEPCKKVFKAFEHPNHFTTHSHVSIASDLVELFYCHYCQVEFNSTSLVFEHHKLTVQHIILKSMNNEIVVKTLSNSYKLNIHLLNYVNNQQLYNQTQNIGFFCFVCDYLCSNLYTWKDHLNSKKHMNSSKGYCLDHRCKICKTLMFGQRQYMLDHYSNPFHMMLKQFTLTTILDRQKRNEIENLNCAETISDKNQTAVSNDDAQGESVNNNKIYSVSKIMDKLSLQSNIECGYDSQGESADFNTKNSPTEMIKKKLYSLLNNYCNDKLKEKTSIDVNETDPVKKSDTYCDDNVQGESTSNNEVNLISKFMDNLTLQSNIECSYDSQGESTDINSVDSVVEVIKKLISSTSTHCNGSLKKETSTDINEMHPVKKSDTQCEDNAQGEFINNNETHSVSKIMDKLTLQSNTECSYDSQGESTDINSVDSVVEVIKKLISSTSTHCNGSLKKETSTDINEMHPVKKSDTQCEDNAQGEFINNNETHSVSKIMDKLTLQSNTECGYHSQGESTDINSINSLVEIIKKLISSSSTQCSSNKDEEFITHKNVINPGPKTHLQSNGKNYIHFYKTLIKTLNRMLKQNRDIKLPKSFYCVTCDFVTPIEKFLEDHNKENHLNETEGRYWTFCEICNLSQVGPSKDLSTHNNSSVHKNMENFQKCDSDNVKKHKNAAVEKNNQKISDEVSNVTKNSGTNKPERKNKTFEVEEPKNRRFYVEVKSAKPEYKKQNWTPVKEIFSPFGHFGVISKHNSCLILFRKLSSMNRMLKDKDKLEELHKFTLNVLDMEEKLPELNKKTEYEFANKEVLLKTINSQIMAINQEIHNPDVRRRLNLLTNSIKNCALPHFPNGKAYSFGSRMSGLALRESDVDVYYDIGGTFKGLLSTDTCTQEDLVKYFGRAFRFHNKDFKQIQLICGARVPIVKFFHVPSGLYCDLSFKSGLSTHNTKLVRLYLTMDERVLWVVCAVVKRWALQNDLKNQSMFTSYALVWLVLFYLMTIDVVPPLVLLRKYVSRSDIMFIEGWDCTFCSIESVKRIWKVPEIPGWDLLIGFFKYYSDQSNLKNVVLCPASGEAMPKEKFLNMPMNSQELFVFNKIKCGGTTQNSTRIKGNFSGEGLALQDPFDLFHNITKVIVPRKLQGFCYLCNKTLEVMTNGTLPYYA